MSLRRKGEKPVVHEPLIWSEDSTIARSINSGDGWLYAWILQQSVTVQKLAEKSGIAVERIDALWHGAGPSDAELEALAVPLRTDAASLHASIRYAAAVVRTSSHGAAI